MKDAEKNRDPERAQKRARADARCALRKLGLLDKLEKSAAMASLLDDLDVEADPVASFTITLWEALR